MTAPASPTRGTRSAARSAPPRVAPAPALDLPPRRWALDLGATAALLAVPIIGFGPTFDGAGYLVAGIGGAALGIAIAAVAAWRRWGLLLIAALTAATYFVFGGALALPFTAIAGVVPSLETLRLLAAGVITSWKQLLTTVAPVAGTDGHLIVPFLLALVAGVATASVALRVKNPAWALIPAAIFLALQIALGVSVAAAPVIQGLIFAIVAIVWLAVRAAWAPSQGAVSIGVDGSAPKGMLARRVLAGAAIVTIAAGAGVATSAFAAPDAPRYVIRDVIIPPFDIRNYPSPLQSFRAYVRDDAEKTLFTASGLPEGARMRLGTMDAYNGTVYNVSDDGAGSSSAFTPVRSNMSADAVGTPTTIRVEIEGLSSVWLPDAGAVTSVTFEGADAEELRRTAHYNESTGTGVVTSRLGTGDSYTLQTLIPRDYSDEALADVDFAPFTQPKQEGVPSGLADLASKAVAEATTPVEQVRALQTMLSKDGFFSHGLEGQVLSRAGHGAERVQTLLGGDQMVGDDEQYAVTMALMAREIGIPARVVMGFYPEEDQAGEAVFAANGNSLHAWTEVAFAGVGWVPFDPTPPEDQVPNDQTTKPKADPKPQVLQPPPPVQEPVDLPPTVPDDRESEDEDSVINPLIGLILAIGGISLLVLAILASPFIVIFALKARRRRERLTAQRASDRISGGWEELVDRAVDYGTPVRVGATRIEDADVVSTAFSEPRVTTLAVRADAEVFGGGEPTTKDVDEFWRQVDEIVQGMGTGASFWSRLRARVSLRSLLAGTRFAPKPRRVVRGADGAGSGRAGAAGADDAGADESPDAPAGDNA